jgi:hypothetical protein
MQATDHTSSLSQFELARRWGKEEAVIRLATAVGTGPRYVKIDGTIRYPFDEVQRYERAFLFINASNLALQTVN